MKNINPYLIFLLITICNVTFAQGDFATIKKNVNFRAIGLQHDLNATKDTLVVSSENKIFRVYTVGEFSGAVDHFLNTNKFEVPLRPLEVGKYVFVVDQSKLKIVFQVFVFGENNTIPAELRYDITKLIEEDNLDELFIEASQDLENSLILLDEYSERNSNKELTLNDLPSLAELMEELEFEEKVNSQRTVKTPNRLKNPNRIEYKNTNPSEGFSLSYQLNARDRIKKIASDNGLVKKRTKKPMAAKTNEKSYNISDLIRLGMQTREEARRERELKSKSQQPKVVNNKSEE